MKTSEDEDAELRNLEKKIAELRSSKKELFEKARPINNELERIAQLEREHVDRQHRLMTEKHEREMYQQTVQRLLELESEMKQLKRENDALRCETSACTDMNNKLRQSLDQATKYSRVQKRKISELEKLSEEQEFSRAKVQSLSETADCTVRELQKQLSGTHKLLNKTKEELNKTRQRLSEVQERLTVAEEVTAATQQRAVLESGNSGELQLELTPQQQLSTHTGFVIIVKK